MYRSRVTFATIEAAAIAALFVSPSTTARCGGAERPELEPVDEAAVGRLAGPERLTQPAQVRAVKPVAVDHAPAGRREPTPARRTRALRGRAPRAVSGSTCFESFRSASGRTRWSREASRVEQHARHDERPGERPAARLVGAGDEAHPEPRGRTRAASGRFVCAIGSSIAPGSAYAYGSRLLRGIARLEL